MWLNPTALLVTQSGSSSPLLL
uniref:Uncharacterized protein n=1 Tax=Anguilla anguilla TaxID=7936 RepID=A0A0E9XWJ4_ANGAN